MYGTWPTENVGENAGRSIADQLQNLGHGDHVTNSPKIDAWHVNAPSQQPACGTEKRNPYVFASDAYTAPGMSAPRPNSSQRNREEEPVCLASNTYTAPGMSAPRPSSSQRNREEPVCLRAPWPSSSQ